MRRVTILGATGSVGQAALDVVASHPDRLSVFGLLAHRRAAELAAAVRVSSPRLVGLVDAAAADDDLRAACSEVGAELVLGDEASVTLAAASEADTVVAAIVGAAGLPATAAAVERGARVALANKESLVVAGEHLTARAAATGAELLPVDSEHAAVHQCLRSGRNDELRRVILTASGGPFRQRPADTFADITVEDALKHPTWTMGAKITIDSATLMNKGLELIEARWLFDLRADQLDVVVHPDSIVHSLVEFHDGSLIAQLNHPDMRDPLRYCLGHPERWEAPEAPGLDLAALGRLEFAAPDEERFPCLRLARQALAAGGAAPAVLNAANEVAVAAFLDRRLAFTEIATLVEDCLPLAADLDCRDLSAALATHETAGDQAQRLLEQRAVSSTRS
ncbi:MAG: 1-deoxy-D-xylulose-5-phosphate reductoisomerase [Acidobacteriota bacterium]